MRTGFSVQIRKTAFGRFLLFHINTGIFWFYGVLTFWLVLSVSDFWLQSITSRRLLSLALALLVAFTLPGLVRALFWHRFRNVWMDSYVIILFFAAILLSDYLQDVHAGRADALSRLATRALAAILAGWFGYKSNRKKKAQASHRGMGMRQSG
jgi:hypothetical protein